MSDNSNTSTSGGIGFCGLLAIILIALKLTGAINWPWIWILGPIWIPISIMFLICLILAICFTDKK